MIRRVLVFPALSVLCVLPAIGASVRELRPFTHIAEIPAGSDISSIRFEGVKIVKVATESKSVSDERYCEQVEMREPGGSERCPYTERQSFTPAYQVTYSYQGQPLTSDEYGSGYFTFSVYLRPDDLSPAVRQTLAEHKLAKSDTAGFFELRTSTSQSQQVVVDEASSKFCDGNFMDGAWMRSDPKCEDRISTKTVAGSSPYITVKVDPAVPTTASNSHR
jgi:hypothetical protein